MMSTTQTEVCQMMAVIVEISAATWVVASSVGGAAKTRRKSLTESGAAERCEALVAEIEQARSRFGLPASARVVVGYEAGQEGFWLVRALRARGYEAEVIDPVSLPVDRRAKRAKTDRLDAQALVVEFWRYLTGETQRLRLVRVPAPEQEDEREWQRERDRLQGERRGCKDRIVKKLHTQGIWKLPKDWRAALREGRLRTVGGEPLGAMLQRTLVMELERLTLAERKLKELQAASEALGEAVRERILRLLQLRGVGPHSARALSLRLYWRDFDNGRQVGACAGLVGVPYQSGTIRQDQGISKAGDPRLRASLVELAWLWLRYQPDSAITRWFFARTQGGGRRGKRVMIVAVARRLAVALWRYLKDGVVPQGAQFKAAVVKA